MRFRIGDIVQVWAEDEWLDGEVVGEEFYGIGHYYYVPVSGPRCGGDWRRALVKHISRPPHLLHDEEPVRVDAGPRTL